MIRGRRVLLPVLPDVPADNLGLASLVEPFAYAVRQMAAAQDRNDLRTLAKLAIEDRRRADAVHQGVGVGVTQHVISPSR
jgi:hypothetical protein